MGRVIASRLEVSPVSSGCLPGRLGISNGISNGLTLIDRCGGIKDFSRSFQGLFVAKLWRVRSRFVPSQAGNLPRDNLSHPCQRSRFVLNCYTMLQNIRHERFARFIARGHSKSKAYHLAGYKPDRRNAFKLYTTNHAIQKRVEQLMKKDSSNLSAQDILDHVYSTFELAYETNQSAAALKALEMLGKERGLWRDRRENVNINLGQLSWQEAESFLKDRYGDRAEMFITMLKQYYSSNTVKPENSGADSVAGLANRSALLTYSDSDADDND